MFWLFVGPTRIYLLDFLRSSSVQFYLLTSWLSFVVSSVSLSLFHWYPGSGVVLDCIDSCSLHHYLLSLSLLYLLFYLDLYVLGDDAYLS